MKSVVGKDLTKVTMPVHFNEPLSFLQVRDYNVVNKYALSTKHEGKSSGYIVLVQVEMSWPFSDETF